MTTKKLTFQSISLLILSSAGLTTIFSLPVKAEQKVCGLYNMAGEPVYDRTNVILDLTKTEFDAPSSVNEQLKNCKAALNEAIDQQTELNINACGKSPQKLVGLFISGKQRAAVVQAKSIYRTVNTTETRYETRFVPICEVAGGGRCVYRYRPIHYPYQVPATASSCRLSS
jgi:hypothetical protein